MEKFKIGDKVVIKKSLTGIDELNGKEVIVKTTCIDSHNRNIITFSGNLFRWNAEMFNLVSDNQKSVGNFKVKCIEGSPWFTTGETYEVKDGIVISDIGNRIAGCFTVEGMNFRFSAKFELIESNSAIVIYSNDNQTIATLRTDGAVIKSAKATCNPADTFSFEIGAKLAVERLLGCEIGQAVKVDKVASVVKQDTYKVGDKVRLVSKRPARWNEEGGMDEHLGKEVVITNIAGTTFDFYGSGRWAFSFNNSIEGKIIEDKLEVKEVKRKAKVGEWVKVVNAKWDNVNYKHGDILQIVANEIRGCIHSYYREQDGHWLYENEYVVLENYTPPAPRIKLLSEYTNRELAAEMLRRYDGE